MNKRKLLIIQLILLISILLVVIVVCFNTSIFRGRFGFPFSFSSSSSEIETITQEYTAIDKFDINLIDESVRFTYYDGTTVKLSYVGKDGDLLIIDHHGSTLEVSKPNSWNLFNFGESAGELVILLPKNTDNYNYSINLISGNIQIESSGINGNFNTVSGKIDINGTFNFLNFETVSGDINSMESATEIDVETVSGKTFVVLAEDGEFDGDSVSGSFTIKVLGDAYDIELDSVSGSLNQSTTITHHNQYSIDVSSVSGSLDIIK